MRKSSFREATATSAASAKKVAADIGANSGFGVRLDLSLGVFAGLYDFDERAAPIQCANRTCIAGGPIPLPGSDPNESPASESSSSSLLGGKSAGSLAKRALIAERYKSDMAGEVDNLTGMNEQLTLCIPFGAAKQRPFGLSSLQDR